MNRETVRDDRLIGLNARRLVISAFGEYPPQSNLQLAQTQLWLVKRCATGLDFSLCLSYRTSGFFPVACK